MIRRCAMGHTIRASARRPARPRSWWASRALEIHAQHRGTISTLPIRRLRSRRPAGPRLAMKREIRPNKSLIRGSASLPPTCPCAVSPKPYHRRSVKFCGNASLRDRMGSCCSSPEKGSGEVRHAGSVWLPRHAHAWLQREVILTTTAGYIASIANIACFFLIATQSAHRTSYIT